MLLDGFVCSSKLVMLDYFNFTPVWFNIIVLEICTHAGFTVFKITVLVMDMVETVMLTALFMTITVGKQVTLIVEEILLVEMRRAPGWKLRSGNLGFSPPEDPGLE